MTFLLSADIVPVPACRDTRIFEARDHSNSPAPCRDRCDIPAARWCLNVSSPEAELLWLAWEELRGVAGTVLLCCEMPASGRLPSAWDEPFWLFPFPLSPKMPETTAQYLQASTMFCSKIFRYLCWAGGKKIHKKDKQGAQMLWLTSKGAEHSPQSLSKHGGLLGRSLAAARTCMKALRHIVHHAAAHWARRSVEDIHTSCTWVI